MSALMKFIARPETLFSIAAFTFGLGVGLIPVVIYEGGILDGNLGRESRGAEDVDHGALTDELLRVLKP